MIRLFILIFFVLFFLSIIALTAVGLCIGVAQLMVYFMPDIGLANALTPSAILASLLMFTLTGALKLWAKSYMMFPEEVETDDEPEPPAVTSLTAYRNRNGRRRKK